MAALYICEVDNLIVEIDGEETPIMDGSSIEFVEKIKKTGLRTLNKNRKFIKINKKI